MLLIKTERIHLCSFCFILFYSILFIV